MSKRSVIIGAAAILLVYIALNYQHAIIGRTLIQAPTGILILLYGSLLAYAVAGFFRLTPLKILFLSLAFLALTEILLYNLAMFGIATPYRFYSSLRIYLFGFIIFFFLSFVEVPRFQVLISTASLFVSGIFGYVLLSKLKLQAEISFAFLAIFVVLALTVLANISKNEAVLWIREKRAFIISIILILAVYMTAVKPLIMDKTGLVNFIEWTIVSVTAYKLSRDFRKRMVIDEVEMIRKHRPKAVLRKDEVYDELERAEKTFVEHGQKAMLIVTLTKHLAGAGWSTEKIAEVLSDLVWYVPSGVPLLAFPWERKLVESKERKRREEIVLKIKESLNKRGVSDGSKRV